MSAPKITIIGTGNLAWHLAPALENAGYVVNEIYGRSEYSTRLITQGLYNPMIVDSLDFSSSVSSLFIIAVSDKAIEAVASEIVLPEEALIVHTSGTAPLSVLEHTAVEQTGIFYPLQTFTKARKINFSEVPIFIEASDEATLKILKKIASSLSTHVKEVSPEDRMNIHLAAVFANNFTNHMLDIANQVMDRSELDSGLLEPLIRETVEKALDQRPSAVQTGPAIREDHETMERHLKRLAFNENYQRLYELISESISDTKK